MAAKKTAAPKGSKCPITKEQFEQTAKPLVLTLEGQTIVVPMHFFSSGSFGFYANPKITLMVGGVPVKFQVGLNVTAIGSKPEAGA